MDPIEKKPLYHFLPGSLSYSIATPGCNFRCTFCQNWQISQVEAAPAFESLGYVEPERVVSAAVAGGAPSISYTYTEPTIFMEYALDCARLARREGLKNVFVTNGFQTPEAVQDMTGLIDAANVDLKAFTDEFYRRQCGGRLQPVLDAIGNMHRAGIHVEVTTLIVPGRNDSDEQLSGIAGFLATCRRTSPGTSRASTRTTRRRACRRRRWRRCGGRTSSAGRRACTTSTWATCSSTPGRTPSAPAAASCWCAAGASRGPASTSPSRAVRTAAIRCR